MTKKKNIEKENNLLEIAKGVVNKDVEHIFVLGLHKNKEIVLGTSFSSFEEIHAILNRTISGIVRAHEEAIAQANKPNEEVVD